MLLETEWKRNGMGNFGMVDQERSNKCNEKNERNKKINK